MGLLLVHSLVASRPARAQVDLLTAGAVLGTAGVTKVLVGDLIEDAAGEVKDLLQQVDALLDDLIRHINDTYADMLNTTVDRLDQLTRTQLMRLSSLLQRLQADLQVGVAQLNETIIADVKLITVNVRQAISDARELVKVGFWGAALVVDKTAFNVTLIVAVILLAIGLLVFTRLLFTRRLPTERLSRSLVLGGMVGFLILLLGLVLPQGRAYALTWAGFGGQVEELTQPKIFAVSPETLVIGRTQEVILSGSGFAPGGQLPRVEIAGVVAPVSGGNEALAINVASLNLTQSTGTQTIRLTTAEDPPKVATAAVMITQKRPLPRVISWNLTPVGTAWVSGGDKTRSGIGCRAPKRRLGETRDCKDEELVRVLDGYELDMDRMAELGRKPEGDVLRNNGDAQRGFTETITTFDRRNGNPKDPTRQIDYDPTSNPRGIKVSVRARNDAGQDPHGKRAEFKATYTVYGRRKHYNVSGREWTFQGSCAISGTVDCGGYPYPGELERFSGDLRYTADVTFRGADDATASGSETLVPNDGQSFIAVPLQYEDTDGRLRSATIQVRMIGRSIRVRGPDLGPPSLPLMGPRLTEVLRKIRRPSTL